MAKMWMTRELTLPERELREVECEYQIFERRPPPIPLNQQRGYGKWGNCAALIMDPGPFETAFGLKLAPGEGPVAVKVTIV